MLKEEAGYLSPLFVFALNYESLFSCGECEGGSWCRPGEG